METGKLVDLKMTPILNFYFYFASFLLKSHKEYGVAWMGVNFMITMISRQKLGVHFNLLHIAF